MDRPLRPAVHHLRAGDLARAGHRSLVVRTISAGRPLSRCMTGGAGFLAGGPSHRRGRGRPRLARRGSRRLSCRSASSFWDWSRWCRSSTSILSRWSGRGATAALAVAVVLQSAIVWDYAFYSDRTAGQIIRARDAVGRRPEDRDAAGFDPQPVSTQSLAARRRLAGGRYGQRGLEQLRDPALLLPGAFPTGHRSARPDDLEWVSIHEDPSEAGERGRAWEQILRQHADSIDVVVVWKSDPALDAITARWFDRVDRRGDIQIFRRRRDGDDDSTGNRDSRSVISPDLPASTSLQSFFFSFLSSNR